MNISFYNAVSGMINYQKDMDVIAHNMANVNTAGYKLQKSSFADLIYTNMDINNNDNKVVGHGTKINSVNLLYKQGVMDYTERPLDFAINGEGLFGVRNPSGEFEYTRNGAFSISVEGNKAFLVTQNGSYALDGAKKPIELVKSADGLGYDTAGISEKLGVYIAPNPYGLSPVGGATFKESEISGAVKALKAGDKNNSYELIAGALERSNVDISDEMIDVIQTQRAFQLNAKVVKISDEIEEIVNNLR